MNLLPVYTLFEIEPVKAKGCYVYDKSGQEYMDFYGGHAVISIGHSHPHYVQKITDQLGKIGFYSNSVENSLQIELANKLGAAMGSDDYELFLCSSGAEANENAIKLASFRNPDSTTFVTLKNSFHGRTSAAVNLTDNEKIKSGVNRSLTSLVFDKDDIDGITKALESQNICAVMIEPIQGVGGLDTTSDENLQKIAAACKATNTTLLMDEVQSGFGRSGRFFAHQFSGIQPDVISIAKGMGNGFPVGGVLVKKGVFPTFPGMLGTTFGGNHLACVATIAVLDTIKEEGLVNNAAEIGNYLKEALAKIPGVVTVKGRGLMVGIEMPYPIAEMRKHLLFENKVFTGNAKDKNVLRVLPPLNITKEQATEFVTRLTKSVQAFQDA